MSPPNAPKQNFKSCDPLLGQQIQSSAAEVWNCEDYLALLDHQMLHFRVQKQGFTGEQEIMKQTMAARSES